MSCTYLIHLKLPNYEQTTKQSALQALRSKLNQGPELGDFVLGKDIIESEKYSVEAPSWKEKKRKPDWMKRVSRGRTSEGPNPTTPLKALSSHTQPHTHYD